jgi:hypothetical protein
MNKMKNLAVTVLAVAGMAGCASAPIADFPKAEVVPAPTAAVQVVRPFSGYGFYGGYRYRRYAGA